jgi:hypothetical protein
MKPHRAAIVCLLFFYFVGLWAAIAPAAEPPSPPIVEDSADAGTPSPEPSVEERNALLVAEVQKQRAELTVMESDYEGVLQSLTDLNDRLMKLEAKAR